MAEKENKEQDPNQINIELTDEIAEGTYSNLTIINHSNSEFVIDFIRMMPGAPKAKVKSRIVLTPHHAKRLLHALTDNMKKFESIHGEVEESEPNNQAPPMDLGGQTQA